MGVREETVAFLKSGLPPSQICRHMGVTVFTTLGYLEQMIGRGEIRRSEVFYTLPSLVRSTLQQVCGPGYSMTPSAISARIKRRNLGSVWPHPAVAEDDIETYSRFVGARFAMSDMYDDIRQVECTLHQLIQTVLMVKIGERESEWWVQGIPLKIRQECASRKEEEARTTQRHAYCFVNTIHLADILDKRPL